MKNETVTLKLESVYMEKVRRAYKIYQAIETTVPEHQMFNEGGDSFEDWLAGRIIEFDQRTARVKRVRSLLGSGLMPHEIRSILIESGTGLRSEEEEILDEADRMVNEEGYTYDEIRQAMSDREFTIYSTSKEAFKDDVRTIVESSA